LTLCYRIEKIISQPTKTQIWLYTNRFAFFLIVIKSNNFLLIAWIDLNSLWLLELIINISMVDQQKMRMNFNNGNINP